MVLHVHVHLRAPLPGQPPQRPQPREHTLARAAGIDGVELAVEGRELERHVHPRQRTVGPVVNERVVRPTGGLGWKVVEQPHVGGRIGIGLVVAGHGLAQQVERECPMVPPLGECGGGGLVGIGPGDESPGLGERCGPHGPGGQRRQNTAAGGLDRHAERRRKPLDDAVVEIFADVPIEGGRVLEHRHAVDESKQPHLELVVLRGPFPGLLHPPVGRDRRRLGGEGLGEKPPPDRLRGGLDGLEISPREAAGEGLGQVLLGRHRRPPDERVATRNGVPQVYQNTRLTCRPPGPRGRPVNGFPAALW